MNSKPALLFGYIVSGSTAATGVVHQETVHLILGHPLPEVALVIGIIGTLSTIVLQALSYTRLLRADKSRRQDLREVNEAYTKGQRERPGPGDSDIKSVEERPAKNAAGVKEKEDERNKRQDSH